MATFLLDIETDPAALTASLRLADAHDRHLAGSEVRLADHAASRWEGLFDTRAHVRRYGSGGRDPAALLAELGGFLGQTILGPDILGALGAHARSRTLLVRLPDVSADPLAAAFARVPWEIARLDGARSLGERNVAVRAAAAGTQPAEDLAVELAPDEALRVLLVYGEAPGSRPLALRLERERVLDLLYDQVMPQRHVEVAVLCHGVTRGAIRDAARAAGGFHIVHWSGHGHHDRLDLCRDDGSADALSGAELAALFEEAGGFLPRLVFLSACHSGGLLAARDYAALVQRLRDEAGARSTGPAPGVPAILGQRPGYTGTALALLGAGVPQVIAMRYEVSDAYARRLARRFYRGLLADAASHPAETALALARGELLRDRRAHEHPAVDHATSLVFGAQPVRFEAARRRSPQLDRRRPQPQPLLPGRRDLDPPFGFVGRSEPLARLVREWLAPKGRPVALIQGLAGLGKTSLAAEAVALWHGRFDAVLAVQSRDPVTAEELYRTLDQRLSTHSAVYQRRCGNPYAAVHLAPDAKIDGAARWQKMRENLVDVLRSERLLLVLDNFEKNLQDLPRDGAHPCRDPEWERLLEALADGLGGSGSRVLVTSRHRPAALVGRAVWIQLGPLPAGEATLLVQARSSLRDLVFGDREGQALAARLLRVTHGHPLLLDRLCDVARDRDGLREVLDRIATRGLGSLPDTLAEPTTEAERAEEIRYLEDVTKGAIDLLLERASPAARTALWLATLAREPVYEALLRAGWATGGEAGPPPGAIVELTGCGLLHSDGGATPAWSHHELVRERVAAWVDARPEVRGGREEARVWGAYGRVYGAEFAALRDAGRPGAMDAAVRAGSRGLAYLLRAGEFDGATVFASELAGSTRSPEQLRDVVAALEAAIEGVPAGRARWGLRLALADALRMAGQLRAALPLYAVSAAEAEAAVAWGDVGVIRQNWANALRAVGRLDLARECYTRSAEAETQAGSPRIGVLAAELEALRIDVMEGRAAEALSAIDDRVAEVRAWWERNRAGEPVPDAPDPRMLARVYVGALDIADQACRSLEDWQRCIAHIREAETAKTALGEGAHSVACTRFNLHGPMLRLGRVDEAKEVLEHCLAVFRDTGDVTNEAMALSALADLWDKKGDVRHAITLARSALVARNRLPDPEKRAISHMNLGIYLERAGEAGDSRRHELAALLYFDLSGHRGHLRTALRNHHIRQSRARAAGTTYELPRVADLLGRDDFAALRAWLHDRAVDPDAAQSRIDALLAAPPP